MTALNRFPARDQLQAAMIVRDGLGWRVGLGSIVAGTIASEVTAHLNDRDAERAAVRLADRHDVVAVRCG